MQITMFELNVPGTPFFPAGKVQPLIFHSDEEIFVFRFNCRSRLNYSIVFAANHWLFASALLNYNSIT